MIKFMCSQDIDEKPVIHSRNNNIEIKTNDAVDEGIDENF